MSLNKRFNQIAKNQRKGRALKQLPKEKLLEAALMTLPARVLRNVYDNFDYAHFEKAQDFKRTRSGMGQPKFEPPPRRDTALMNINSEAPVGVAASYSTLNKSGKPIIRAAQNSCRIVHKELLGNISSTQTYSIQSTFALNPGLASTFPWLSTQAANWEMYRFHKLDFCYYTRTGSSSGGSVLLIPDYDSADSPPNLEVYASNYADMVEDAPWKDICCKLKVNAMFPMGPKKYIRNAGLTANLDIKTYDSGTLFVGSNDGPSSVIPWGKLWVEYDVELFVPTLAFGSVVVSQHVKSTSGPSSSGIMIGGITQPGSSSIVTWSGNVVTFNLAGTYCFILYLNANTTVTVPSCTLGAGAINVPNFSNNNSIDGSGTTDCTCTNFLVTPIGGTITFGALTVVGGGAGSEIFVCSYPAAQT